MIPEIDNNHKLFIEDVDDTLYALRFAKGRCLKVKWGVSNYRERKIMNKLNKAEELLSEVYFKYKELRTL